MKKRVKMSVKDRIAMYVKKGLKVSELLHDPDINIKYK